MPATDSSKTGRPRGRRPAANVPCNECIARASEKKEEGAAIELCSKCTSALHRPRRKSDQTSVKRLRRQSVTLPEAIVAKRTDLNSAPWSSPYQEQHSLQFFATHSSPQLAGYFDSPFWQRMVVQTGQHEPAVRHAIAAIGALHETLLIGAADPIRSWDDVRTTFALEQCNASIQHLVQPSRPKSKPDLQLMLTTCVLYTCFEALQGHCEQAVTHATQGYSLLHQYAVDPKNRRWDVGAFAVELDHLSLLIRRLQTRSRSLSLDKNFKALPDSEWIKHMRPLNFHSLQDARSSLELALNHLSILFLDMELDDSIYQLAMSDSDRALTYKPWLSEWESAFSIFLSKRQASLSEEDRQIAMTLKAHHLVAEILSEVDLSLHELAWNLLQDKFSAIVNLAAAVLKDHKSTDASPIEVRWKADSISGSAPSATHSFSLGIVDPLYQVCARCNDPVLRRRALDMLANHPRQDCVWSSCSVWKVGKRLVQCEEPEEKRLGGDLWDPRSRPRNPRPSTSISQSSSKQTATPEISYTKPTYRTLARYALNPGLFEDCYRAVNGSAAETMDSLPYPGSKVAFSQPSFTPGRNNALATAVPDGYGALDWIEYDTFQQLAGIPTIHDTPSDD